MSIDSWVNIFCYGCLALSLIINVRATTSMFKETKEKQDRILYKISFLEDKVNHLREDNSWNR